MPAHWHPAIEHVTVISGTINMGVGGKLEPPKTKPLPAGSVAIGGSQTGVYPFATPGGWRLIGQTPLRMFDPGRSEMSRLRMGDIVRFKPE